MFDLGEIMTSQRQILDSLLVIVEQRDKTRDSDCRDILNIAIEDFKNGTKGLMGFIENEVEKSRWKS